MKNIKILSIITVILVSIIIAITAYNFNRAVDNKLKETRNTNFKLYESVSCNFNPQNMEVAFVSPNIDNETDKVAKNGAVATFYQLKYDGILNFKLEKIGLTSFGDESYKSLVNKVRNADCQSFRTNEDGKSYQPTRLTENEQKNFDESKQKQDIFVEEGMKKLEYEKLLPSKPLQEQLDYCLQKNVENNTVLQAIKNGKTEYNGLPLQNVKPEQIESTIAARTKICGELQDKIETTP
jgi:hypothetical protein